LGDIGDGDLRRALGERHLHREEPDRSRARHQHVVAGPDVRLPAGPDAHRERLHQRASVVREVVRQRKREVLMDRHVVREGAVDGGRREEADVWAKVIVACPALAAGQIGNARFQCHPLTDLVFGGLFSHSHDGSHRLVAQDQGLAHDERADASFLVVVHVGAANADGPYLYEHLL
jgi:hypothetical protein